MAPIAGRRQRTKQGGKTAYIQARVRPTIRERAERGAAVRGLSVTRYMEELILADELAEAVSDDENEDDQMKLTA